MEKENRTVGNPSAASRNSPMFRPPLPPVHRPVAGGADARRPYRTPSPPAEAGPSAGRNRPPARPVGLGAAAPTGSERAAAPRPARGRGAQLGQRDRKSTRLNSS